MAENTVHIEVINPHPQVWVIVDNNPWRVDDSQSPSDALTGMTIRQLRITQALIQTTADRIEDLLHG